MARSLRIGVVQATSAKTKQESLRRINSLLSRNRVEADLLVFPEYLMADPTGEKPEFVAGVAEELNGEWIQFFQEIAREYSVYIVASMFEKNSRSKPYNTVFVLDSSGAIISTYRKIHLFNAYGYRESDYFEPGGEIPSPVDIKGFKVGLSVCFDLRFPELYRAYALMGADIVVVPSAWYSGPLKEETLRSLLKARAHENTIYLAAPVLYGKHFTGRSMVIDPYGVVILDLGIGEKYAEINLYRDILEEARKTLPLLEMRRPDLYRKIL